MNRGSHTRPIEHLTRISDLHPETLIEILELAEMMKAEPSHCQDVLRGRVIACSFEQPATRTRVSIAAAAARLGATPIMLRPEELHLGTGESIADAARSLSDYVDAIVVGASEQQTIEHLAREARVPVMTALSESHHPFQALSTLLTIKEAFGDLAGRRLAFLGDGGCNVAQSLIEACALAEMNLTIACPPEHGPDPDLLSKARSWLEETGVELQVIREPGAAVAGAHAVYADSWASSGDESKSRALRDYQVTDKLMTLAQPGAVFLHSLPAARGVEASAAVIDGPQSAVWSQSANRLPIEEAVLLLLTRGVER